MKITPQDFGLPADHASWRTGQKEALDWLFKQLGNTVVESPTGSGKTSWPAAISTEKTVVALVKTKGLQATNYDAKYGFDALYGRSNYDCIHPDAAPAATCADCLYAEKGMRKCPFSGECLYMVQKEIAKGSPRVSLNYAYWLTAKWPRQEPPQYLFLDEGHNLSEIVVDWAGCTIRMKELREWSLPPFPKIDGRRQSGSVLFNVPTPEKPTDKALEWLIACRLILRRAYASLRNRQGEKEQKARKRCENLGRKVSATLAAIERCPNDWYIRSGPNALKYGRSQRPGFVCKPLTARHHFRSYFDVSETVVAMSATIGDFATYGAELGLSSFSSHVVPPVWGPETRPVLALDAPKMGRSTSPAGYEKQASVIAKAILGAPPHWSGVIHVTRIKEASLLAERLARNGLQGRMWTPPRVGTDRQIQAWEREKARRKALQLPGALCVTWAWKEGVDLLEEKINILAKCHFPFLGDEYERARMRYDGKMFNQRAAWDDEQSLGRTRRGREEDYDTPTEKRGLNAIADGNYIRLKKYYSQALQEAIVT